MGNGQVRVSDLQRLLKKIIKLYVENVAEK